MGRDVLDSSSPYLRVLRDLSKTNLPGYVGFLPYLRNFRLSGDRTSYLCRAMVIRKMCLYLRDT